MPASAIPCSALSCPAALSCLVVSCLVRSGPVYFYSITALLSAAWLSSTLVDLKRAALPRCSAQVARTCMFMLPCLAGRSFRNLEALDATVPHSPLQTRPRSFNNSHPHRGPTTTTTTTLHCTALHCLDAQLRAHRGPLARTRTPPPQFSTQPSACPTARLRKARRSQRETEREPARFRRPHPAKPCPP